MADKHFRTLMPLDYQTIFKELNEIGIDYLIVGGLAVNFHGIPRMTYDIDLMILLEPENILKLISKLREWGYRPSAPVNPEDLADEEKRKAWIQDKGMIAFNFCCEAHPIGEIDLVLESFIPYNQLKERAVWIDIGSTRIPVISIHDLIDLKRRIGRKQDLSDVEHLKIVLER